MPDRAAYLIQGRRALANAGRVATVSAIYETAAWGMEDQPAFLNQVIALLTPLSAPALLAACQAAEQQAGRQRTVRWAARTLDVDILFFGQEIINAPGLTVPHPALAFRRFALTPLAELAPELRHPVLGQTTTELLAACPDLLSARLWTEA